MLAEWRFAPQSRAVGAYYFNRITDLIATVTDPRDGLLVNVNEQSVIGRGLEAEIEGHTSFGLEVFGASLADPGGPEHRQDRIPQPGRQFWLKVDFAFR